MPQVMVARARQTITAGGANRTATIIHAGGERLVMWFETDAGVPPLPREGIGDVALPIALLIAMRRGEDLRLRDSISPGRSARLHRIQEILTTWYPDRFSRIRVKAAKAITAESPRTRYAASCFTGGVDSFATMLRTRPRLGALAFAEGFDVSLTDPAALAARRDLLLAVAAEHSLDLLSVRTNARRIVMPYCLWGAEAHGAALASLGTILSSRISRLYIPATYTYRDSWPWGSHPMMDGLWSTRRLKVVHHGADQSRLEKYESLLARPEIISRLAVCLRRDVTNNCGTCLKCVREMVTLELYGVLADHPGLFDQPLHLEAVATLALRNANDVARFEDLLALAAARQPGSDLEAALRQVLAKPLQPRQHAQVDAH
jgi:hypothetical protein